MESSKKQSKITYYYNTHNDSTHTSKWLVAQHYQRAREDDFFNLNSQDNIIIMNPELPAPFQP
jgi:hypothetical protein